MTHATRFDDRRGLELRDALAQVPTPQGKPFAELFGHGSLTVELYAPRGRDPQTPHTRDEVYVLARGSATFVNGAQRLRLQAGDVAFAAAGEPHFFDELSEDFATWVFFYGPEGGEQR